MTTIKVLVEDTAANSDLAVEHGLSLYVETAAQKFIFDCGQSGLAWENAAKLGVDLTRINFVVLSHSHYDHAGGFPSLLKIVKPKKIYTGRNFWQEKYSRTAEGFKYRGAGFTFQDLARWNVAQKICDDLLELDVESWLVGNFQRWYKFETIPEKFVRGEEKLPDNFDDEICLVLREGDGVAVVVACSHVGILNIVSTVQKRLDLPVKTLIGGVHLLDADSERIEKTLDLLESFGVKRFALCHCSGDKIRTNFSTGSVLEI